MFRSLVTGFRASSKAALLRSLRASRVPARSAEVVYLGQGGLFLFLCVDGDKEVARLFPPLSDAGCTC